MTPEPQKWPDAPPFPPDAQLVPGIHPGLEAHTYRAGKYTNYIVIIEYEAQAIVEQIKADLEQELGGPVRTRNVKFKMPGGGERWWLSVRRSLLTKLDEWSRPEPGEVGPEAGKPRGGVVDTRDAVDAVLAAIETLASALTQDSSCFAAGGYLPMHENPVEIKTRLIRERCTILSAQAQLKHLAEVLAGLRGLEDSM